MLKPDYTTRENVLHFLYFLAVLVVGVPVAVVAFILTIKCMLLVFWFLAKVTGLL